MKRLLSLATAIALLVSGPGQAGTIALLGAGAGALGNNTYVANPIHLIPGGSLGTPQLTSSGTVNTCHMILSYWTRFNMYPYGGSTGGPVAGSSNIGSAYYGDLIGNYGANDERTLGLNLTSDNNGLRYNMGSAVQATGNAATSWTSSGYPTTLNNSSIVGTISQYNEVIDVQSGQPGSYLNGYVTGYSNPTLTMAIAGGPASVGSTDALEFYFNYTDGNVAQPSQVYGTWAHHLMSTNSCDNGAYPLGVQYIVEYVNGVLYYTNFSSIQSGSMYGVPFGLNALPFAINKNTMDWDVADVQLFSSCDILNANVQTSTVSTTGSPSSSTTTMNVGSISNITAGMFVSDGGNVIPPGTRVTTAPASGHVVLSNTPTGNATNESVTFYIPGIASADIKNFYDTTNHIPINPNVAVTAYASSCPTGDGFPTPGAHGSGGPPLVEAHYSVAQAENVSCPGNVQSFTCGKGNYNDLTLATGGAALLLDNSNSTTQNLFYGTASSSFTAHSTTTITLASAPSTTPAANMIVYDASFSPPRSVCLVSSYNSGTNTITCAAAVYNTSVGSSDTLRFTGAYTGGISPRDELPTVGPSNGPRPTHTGLKWQCPTYSSGTPVTGSCGYEIQAGDLLIAHVTFRDSSAGSDLCAPVVSTTTNYTSAQTGNSGSTSPALVVSHAYNTSFGNYGGYCTWAKVANSTDVSTNVVGGSYNAATSGLHGIYDSGEGSRTNWSTVLADYGPADAPSYAATASFSTGSSVTIPLNTSAGGSGDLAYVAAPASLATGLGVYDLSNGMPVGTVTAYSGHTMTIGTVLNASLGSSDVLMISPIDATTLPGTPLTFNYTGIGGSGYGLTTNSVTTTAASDLLFYVMAPYQGGPFDCPTDGGSGLMRKVYDSMASVFETAGVGKLGTFGNGGFMCEQTIATAGSVGSKQISGYFGSPTYGNSAASGNPAYPGYAGIFAVFTK